MLVSLFWLVLSFHWSVRADREAGCDPDPLPDAIPFWVGMAIHRIGILEHIL